jgi:hypothetical protein
LVRDYGGMAASGVGSIGQQRRSFGKAMRATQPTRSIEPPPR